MTNSTIETFRNNVKFYRTLRNLTQDKLSELAGVSTDYISEIERGKKTPSFKRLLLIAEVLKIEPYLLLKPQDK